MRIVVHDYAGHPFQVQLSRALARRGHEVMHAFSSSFLTPQGALQVRDDDPSTFSVCPIVLGEKVAKGNFLKRRQQDHRHGELAVEKIAAFRPDVVLSGNTPLDAQKQILGWCHSSQARFVFWVQDLIGQAAKRLLGPRFPLVGGLAGDMFIRFEESLLRQSDAVVVISSDFLPFVPSVKHGVTHVIENWAPLHEMPLRDRENGWAKAHDLSEGINFLYSGTIGLKHNHELLLAMGSALKSVPGARVTIISEGTKAELVKEEIQARGLDNMQVLPFQPFADLPDALGSADILMAILEEDAGVFSVPSKVLSNLCAGRALLLAVPPENLAARIVSGQGAGLVVAPSDESGFVEAGLRLAHDPSLRAQMGAQGRAYAETAFDIESITNRFESILAGSGAVSSAA
jgi:glycosyltransferase involved in cell wall biosynthesis